MAEQSGAPQAEGPLGLDLSPVTPAEHLLSAALAPGGELYQPRPEGLFGHLLQTAIEPLQAAPAAAQGTLADRLAGLGNIVIPYVVGGAPRDALSAGVRLSTGDLGGYHGTPHMFEPEPGAPFGSFRDEAIGSGEGAQAYGWGHYIAGNPKVAEGYQKTLSADDSSGHLLEVHILPEESQLLDWDKPLSEQSPEVQEALGSGAHAGKLLWHIPEETGHEIYRRLSYFLQKPLPPDPAGTPAGWGYIDRGIGDPQAASAALHSAGIPGLRYLDAGSRNPSYYLSASPDYQRLFGKPLANQGNFSSKQAAIEHLSEVLGIDPTSNLVSVNQIPQTHNYVIFHPSNLRIVARDGTPLTPVDHDPFAEGAP